MVKLGFKKQAHRLIALLLLCGATVSCTEKNLYDPEANALPPADSYFGYELRGDIKLNINYDAPGFTGLIEIFDQNPMENNAKKEGLAPVYTAFINDGKLERTISIPTNVKEAYLYTDKWGLPQCIQMEVSKEAGIVYDATKKTTRAVTRAEDDYLTFFKGDKAPYGLTYRGYDRSDNIKALYKWPAIGFGDSYLSGTAPYATKTDKVGEEAVGTFADRIWKKFDTTADKKTLVRNADVTNIVIKEDGTKLDFIFLNERGAYHNAVGYYYYKTGFFGGSRSQLLNLPKYLVLPSATDVYGITRVLPSGTTFKLQFFGQNGTELGTDEFPAGYTVGWFFYSDGFDITTQNLKGGNPSALFYSNDTGNMQHFVALNDPKSGAVVMGFEDTQNMAGADDYSDVLFIVKSNKKIDEGDRPEIDPGEPEVTPGTDTKTGLLAFEDLWPSDGDYDMNDAAIQYSRAISFDKNNKVTQVVEKFKSATRSGSASLFNYFGYQMENVGTVHTSSTDVVSETTTNSMVIKKSIKKQLATDEYTITRTGLTGVDKDAVAKDFNPYIIVHTTDAYVPGEAGRKEIHLPKYAPTSLADKSLNNTVEDAYYIKKDGSFPFAIDIPMWSFDLADEGKRIDLESQYPRFGSWVASKGEKDTDWYLKKGK